MEALGAEVVLPLLARSGPVVLAGTSSLKKPWEKKRNDSVMTVLMEKRVALRVFNQPFGGGVAARQTGTRFFTAADAVETVAVDVTIDRLLLLRRLLLLFQRSPFLPLGSHLILNAPLQFGHFFAFVFQNLGALLDQDQLSITFNFHQGSCRFAALVVRVD